MNIAASSGMRNNFAMRTALEPLEPPQAPDPLPPAPRARAGRNEQVQSLIKGLTLLSAFANAEVLGNLELARRTGYPKATVSRLTSTLSALGYLRRDELSRGFAIGTRLMGMGASVERNIGLLRVARPLMAALAQHSDMSVGVGVRDRLGITLLELERPRNNRLVINSDAGTVLPIESTAIGLAYLAAAPVGETSRLLDALRKRHPHDWPEVRQRIALANEELASLGFVTSQKSWGREVSAVAVATRVPHQAGLFVFNCAGPASQLDHQALHKQLGPSLCEMVSRITQELQFHPVAPLRPLSVHVP